MIALIVSKTEIKKPETYLDLQQEMGAAVSENTFITQNLTLWGWLYISKLLSKFFHLELNFAQLLFEFDS